MTTVRDRAALLATVQAFAAGPAPDSSELVPAAFVHDLCGGVLALLNEPVTDARVEAALHSYHETTPTVGFEWREGEPKRMRAALEAARDAS